MTAQTSPKKDTDFEWPAAEGNPGGAPDKTDEFSFLLRACPGGVGVGVFATHDINKGTYLRLFDEPPGTDITKIVPRHEVPGEFIKFCLDADEPGMVFRPIDFTRMDLVWFLNHGNQPNAYHDGEYYFYALRDIKAGEEVTVDYGSL